MSLTRKQREIQDREQRILEVARRMLADGGYLGLSMDRIAAEMQYAKGTIYQHFSCKEEIIIALAIETSAKRQELFRRASAFSGRPRDRMAAIGMAAEIFVRRYPQHFQVEQMIRTASLWEKTSEDRRMVMRTCEHCCTQLVSGVVRDGVAAGDLTLPPGFSPEDLCFGLWSITSGAHAIIATSDSMHELGMHEPFGVLHVNVNRMLDGFGWEPLFQEDAFADVRRRIQDEVFPDECSGL